MIVSEEDRAAVAAVTMEIDRLAASRRGAGMDPRILTAGLYEALCITLSSIPQEVRADVASTVATLLPERVEQYAAQTRALRPNGRSRGGAVH